MPSDAMQRAITNQNLRMEGNLNGAEPRMYGQSMAISMKRIADTLLILVQQNNQIIAQNNQIIANTTPSNVG